MIISKAKRERNSDGREILLTSRHKLDVGPAEPFGRRRNADFSEDLSGAEIGLVIVDEKLLQRYDPFAFGACESDLGVQRHKARPGIGERVALTEISADGSHVPYSGLRDFTKGLMDQRIVGSDRRRKLDLAVACSRPDSEPLLIVVADVVEIGNLFQADDKSRI